MRSGIETIRLRIRTLESSDERLFRALYTDAETMSHISEPLSDVEAKRSFEFAMRQDTHGKAASFSFAMDLKDRAEPVGICGIRGVDLQAGTAELGMILRPYGRSQGLATEGLAALVTLAFATFPIRTVWVQYAPEHVVAERLVIRVGFVRCSGEGILGACPDKRVWSIERSSWGTGHPPISARGAQHVEHDRDS